MSATDELRRMLDERGVEWTSPRPGVTWFPDERGMNCKAQPWTVNTFKVSRYHLTPEQAIAVTLGGDECTSVGAIEAWNQRADTEWGAVPATEEVMAAHGWVRERTCEFVIEDNMNETEGMGDVWFCCTNCDTAFDYYADNWLMNERFCPRCGAKVRKAVER